MHSIAAYDEPSQADCIDGEVVLIGPGVIAASMTPAAAAETARRLCAAARKASQAPPPADGGPVTP
jgi:hypothetical protein